MAEGVRIRHHTRRSQMVAVPLLELQLTGPPRPPCKWCHEQHLCKVVHLEVDDQGAAIVARRLWELIQRKAPNWGGFRAVNPVRQPPAQPLKPKLVAQKVKVFDLDDGQHPIHTVDLEEIVKHLMAEVPDATEDQVMAFLLAKVLEQGPAVSER